MKLFILGSFKGTGEHSMRLQVVRAETRDHVVTDPSFAVHQLSDLDELMPTDKDGTIFTLNISADSGIDFR